MKVKTIKTLQDKINNRNSLVSEKNKNKVLYSFINSILFFTTATFGGIAYNFSLNAQLLKSMATMFASGVAFAILGSANIMQIKKQKKLSKKIDTANNNIVDHIKNDYEHNLKLESEKIIDEVYFLEENKETIESKEVNVEDSQLPYEETISLLTAKVNLLKNLKESYKKAGVYNSSLEQNIENQISCFRDTASDYYDYQRKYTS